MSNSGLAHHAPEQCQLCPHRCGANRVHRHGLCRSPHTQLVAAVCRHTGEEPPISGPHGICNVFFAGCNLRCAYCQNHQISRGGQQPQPHWLTSLPSIADSIEALMQQGCTAVGFVSPSHQVPQMLDIIDALHQRGLRPRVVYNSNGYDCPHVLRQLEGVVDVYLPDFKYSDNRLAQRCSGAPRYVQVATEAIGEMFRQKGASLVLNEQGEAEFGLIVRHLVLPGHVANSIGVLRRIAERISPRVHVSLMSQYYPPSGLALRGSWGRQLHEQEYAAVMAEYEALHLRGWTQELCSAQHYQPDFEKMSPFGG